VHDIRNNALNTSHHLGGSAPQKGQQHDTTRLRAGVGCKLSGAIIMAAKITAPLTKP
jgi:hypothetical protein